MGLCFRGKSRGGEGYIAKLGSPATSRHTSCLLWQIAVIFPARVTAETLHPAANSWGAGEYNAYAKPFSWKLFRYLNTV